MCVCVVFVCVCVCVCMCTDVYLSSVSSGLTVIEIVAIIVGCVVAIAVVCCVLGTTVDCIVHIYRSVSQPLAYRIAKSH